MKSRSTFVTDVHIPCAAIGGMLWYRAIVPRVAAGERLPVLYLLHGGTSNPEEMQQDTNAVQEAIAERLIIVTPYAAYSWYTNAKHKPNERWEEAVSRDLIRDADSRFPTLAGREHRGLAGVSMGGYGATKLAIKHPELYGFAAMMGGSLDVTRRWPAIFNPGQSWDEWMIFGFRPSTRLDEDVFVLLPQMANPQAVKWFASCGTEDSTCEGDTEFVRQLRLRGADRSVGGVCHRRRGGSAGAGGGEFSREQTHRRSGGRIGGAWRGRRVGRPGGGAFCQRLGGQRS